MTTKLTLADYAFAAWKHELDNRVFDSHGDSIVDYGITETEMRELFDEDLPPWRAAIELVGETTAPRSEEPVLTADALPCVDA